MKHLLILAALIAMPVVATGCNAPPTTVACAVSGTSSLSCTVDGFTVSAPIPPDIATVIGLLPALDAASPTAASPVSCVLNTKTRVVTCTNKATGKSAMYPLAAASLPVVDGISLDRVPLDSGAEVPVSN